MQEKFLILNERSRMEIENFLPDESAVNKLALYFQCFSDSTRVRILSVLALRDLCVNDLAKILNMNQTTISHQLKLLKDQGLIEFKRDGKILIYRLKSQIVNELLLYAINNLMENGA